MSGIKTGTDIKRFMADFETLTGRDAIDETYVWASGICSIDNPYDENYLKIWNSDEPLYDFLSSFPYSECYFHNLKFDGHFIMHYLLSNGFTYDEELTQEKTFNTLITDTGQWYMIDVRWKDIVSYKDTLRKVKRKLKDGSFKEYKVNQKKNKTIPSYTRFKDSLKKIPLPLKSIPKAYGIPMNKLTLDYTKFRPKNGELTDDEIAYLKADLQIPAIALNNDIIKEQRDKLTASSDAMDDFQSRLKNFQRQCKYSWNKMSDDKLKKTCFREYFPCLDEFYIATDYTYDNFIRKSYKGGWTYYKYKEEKTIGDGLVFDVNSLYPSVMYECNMPYGIPYRFDGCYDKLDEKIKKEYPLYITHITCNFIIKKNYLPCIQIKGSFRFGDTEYLTSSGNDVVDLYLTNIDLELIKDHYHLDNIEYYEGLAFKCSSDLFKDYIDYWTDIKIKAGHDGNKALRSLAKRMLNSLYGKFGTNPKSKIKIPYFNEEGIVKFTQELGDDRESIYTAISSFTTAYARNKTIRSAQCNYQRFYYADTDSIHLSGLEPPQENDLFKIHESDLGKWKCEMVFHKAKYIRSKTYLESPYLKNGKIVENPLELDETCIKSESIEVKCAGMPDNCKKDVTYENFKCGAIYDGKLMPKTIKGGVVLVETTYQIKENKIF